MTKQEPVAIQCGTCKVYSQYNIKYNSQKPRGWKEDDVNGFTCNECKEKGKK